MGMGSLLSRQPTDRAAARLVDQQTVPYRAATDVAFPVSPDDTKHCGQEDAVDAVPADSLGPSCTPELPSILGHPTTGASPMPMTTTARSAPDFLTAMAVEPQVASAAERNKDLVDMQLRMREFSPQVHQQVQRLEQENRISLALRRQRGW